MSYFNPYYSNNPNQVTVPENYTTEARKKIHESLNLAHKSSPLALSSFTRSNESISTQTSNSSATSGLEPRIRRIGSALSRTFSRHKTASAAVFNASNISISNVSSASLASSTNTSAASTRSRADSLFTNVTSSTAPSSVSLATSVPMITLADALPQNNTANGAVFRKLPLLDWDLNQLRSLLIHYSLQPWGGSIPLIFSPPGFRVQHLRLDASVHEAITVLVNSDLYKERVRDVDVRTRVAQRAVGGAVAAQQSEVSRQLPGAIAKPGLSPNNWRHMINMFLVGLAVEAQCLHDYKKIVAGLKKSRKAPKASKGTDVLREKKKDPLLKKAIINDVASHGKYQLPKNALVTKEEGDAIWRQVRENVTAMVGSGAL